VSSWKKGINKKDFGYISPIRPRADVHRIWHSCRGRRRNHLWQIFWRSLKGCRFCRGPKIAISHWLSQSPLTLGWRYRAARDNGWLIIAARVPTSEIGCTSSHGRCRSIGLYVRGVELYFNPFDVKRTCRPDFHIGLLVVACWRDHCRCYGHGHHGQCGHNTFRRAVATYDFGHSLHYRPFAVLYAKYSVCMSGV